MAQNYDLTQTGPELQARIDQVYPNRDAIEQETETREAQDESLETSLKEYTDTEQARAEAAEGALDTRVSANEVDIDLLKSEYEALTQSDIIVGPLPSTGQPNKIYRVPGSTYYTDYMWANGGWVKLAEYSTLDGYVYKGIATPSGTPVQSAEAVFYFALQPGTYTNYGGLVVTNTIAILKYNGTEWTKDDVITIDEEPTAGSDNLVTSGAVAASVVYDISAANAVGGQLATYADLAAALDGGANVPVDVRKGGMEIKFVHSSDNKYVQYRLMANTFNTTEANWQGVDEEPIAGSENLVKSGGVEAEFIKLSGCNKKLIPQGLIVFTNEDVAPGAHIVGNVTLTHDATGCLRVYFSDDTYRDIAGWVNGSHLGESDDFDYVLPNNYTRVAAVAGSFTLDLKYIPSVEDAFLEYKNLGYLFAGIAFPTTTPILTTEKIFYIAYNCGTYSNFNALFTLQLGETAIISYNNGWSLTKISYDFKDAIIGQGGVVFNNSIVPAGTKISGNITPYQGNDACCLRVYFTDDTYYDLAGWTSGSHYGQISSFENYILPSNYSYLKIVAGSAVINVGFGLSPTELKSEIALIDQGNKNNSDNIKGLEDFLGINNLVSGNSSLWKTSKLIGINGELKTVSDSWEATDNYISVSPGMVIKAALAVTSSNSAFALYSAQNEESVVTKVIGKGNEMLYDYYHIVGENEHYVRFSRYVNNRGYVYILDSSGTVLDVSEKGMVVSDPSREVMTQCPSAQYDNNGYVYLNYYQNPSIKEENPENSTFVRLAKFNITKPWDVDYVDVLKYPEVIGDFQVGNYATYDPTMLIIGNDILNLVVALDGSNNAYRGYVCRKANKNTLDLENVVNKLTFSYIYDGQEYTVPMFENNLSVYVDRIMGRTPGTSYYGRPALSQPVYYDGYYYSYMGGLVYGENVGKGYPGTIVRSADGVAWEEVFCPTSFVEDYGITDILEGAVEIIDDNIYVCLRAGHAATFAYNLTSNTISISPKSIIDNYGDQRNALFVHNNYLYAFVSKRPNIQTLAGTPIRTRMCIMKLDKNLNNCGEYEIISKYGLVYPAIIRASAGLYMLCAENRRWDYRQETGETTDPTYPCSDIAIIPIELLENLG